MNFAIWKLALLDGLHRPQLLKTHPEWSTFETIATQMKHSELSLLELKCDISLKMKYLISVAIRN